MRNDNYTYMFAASVVLITALTSVLIGEQRDPTKGNRKYYGIDWLLSKRYCIVGVSMKQMHAWFWFCDKKLKYYRIISQHKI